MISLINSRFLLSLLEEYQEKGILEENASICRSISSGVLLEESLRYE